MSLETFRNLGKLLAAIQRENYLYRDQNVPVVAVVYSENAILEANENNNSYSFGVSSSLACPQGDMNNDCVITINVAPRQSRTEDILYIPKALVDG